MAAERKSKAGIVMEMEDLAPAADQRRDRRPALLAAAGMAGAVAASTCCIAPLVLFGLGVSGAWIGNLTALAPYQPIVVAVTLGFLTAGYWLVYRTPAAACAADSGCSRPPSRRSVKIALWAATALTAAALAFPYLAPSLLEV